MLTVLYSPPPYEEGTGGTPAGRLHFSDGRIHDLAIRTRQNRPPHEA